MTRKLWVVIHRWAGLGMASFLILVGLTGSLLAFLPELERLINPQYYPAQSSGEPLGVGELADRVEQIVPEAQVNAVILEANNGATVASVGSRGETASLTISHLALDRYTGEELHRYRFAAILDDWKHVMQFVYKLHYNLAMGAWGMWILGICALIWTLDCLVGLYLTLPARRRGRAASRFFPPGRGKVKMGVEALVAATVPSPSLRSPSEGEGVESIAHGGDAGDRPGRCSGGPAATSSTSTCTGPAASGSGPCYWCSPGPAST